MCRLRIGDAIAFIYRIMLLSILLILIIAKKIPYSEYHRRVFALSNVWLFLIGGVLLAGLLMFFKISYRFMTQTCILDIIVFICSLYIGISTMYITGWDAGTVIEDAIKLACDEPLDSSYYSVHPNNQMLLVIWALILQVARMIGITTKSGMYGCLVVAQCILFFLTGIILRDIIYNLFSNKLLSMYGWGIYTLLVGFSPWISIAYSDSAAVVFPILIIWLFIKIKSNNMSSFLAKWTIITIVAVIGYQIKATIVVAFIAVLIAGGICSNNNERYTNGFSKLMVVFLTTSALWILSGHICGYAFRCATGAEYDEEKSLSAYHYMMVGLNDEYSGVFNFDDDSFSIYISDSSERKSKNKAVIKERLKTLGVSGLIDLLVRKTANNFNDGSFGYGLGDESFIEEELVKDSSWNEWIRSILLPGGCRFSIYLTFVQALWLAVLTGGFFCMKSGKGACAVFLTIVGITLFTALFEAQQRYLFVFAPIFIISFTGGISRFCLLKESIKM